VMRESVELWLGVAIGPEGDGVIRVACVGSDVGVRRPGLDVLLAPEQPAAAKNKLIIKYLSSLFMLMKLELPPYFMTIYMNYIHLI
jgi:hypothetical protein